MDFLFNNPIANMHGPTFLFFYAVMIATAFLLFRIIRQRMDWTAKMPIPPIPNPIDPYEIAFLRGGENELARFISFSLKEKGFLKITEAENKYFLSQQPSTPNWTTLPEIERASLPWFQQPRETKDLFAGYGLIQALKPFTGLFEQKFRQQNLLTPLQAQKNANILKALIIIGIIALGGYKLIAAISHGYPNFGFLIVMMIASFIIGMLIKGLPRVSNLGQRYLDSLRNAFENINRNTAARPAAFGAANPALIGFGIIGAAALSGFAFTEYERAFKVSAASGGGCGSSCGSSCSAGGDGGGGGGCGGCGGGGD